MKKNVVSNEINPNINLLKLVSIFIIVIYHIYVVLGIKYYDKYLDSIINTGGTVGVTLFFVLSGYCIYLYLSKHKNIKYSDFVISRWKKLSPDYYFSLFISFIFMESIFYFSYAGFLNIMSHLLYIHNLFYDFSGAINGVCWTLGTIFQFYLIAPLLKKMVDKKPLLTLCSTILLDIIIKYLIIMIIFRYCIVDADITSFHFSTYGSEIFTSIGIFCLGMFICKKNNDSSKSNNIFYYIMSLLSICILIAYVLCLNGYFPIFKAPMYSANLKTVFMLDFLAIILGIIIIFVNKIKVNDKIANIVNIFVKYEYSIYIWHLFFITNICRAFDFMERFNIKSKLFAIVVLFIISIFLSIIMHNIIQILSLNVKKIFDFAYKIKFQKISKVIIIVFIVYFIHQCYLLIPSTKVDIENFKTNTDCIGSCKIYESSLEKMKCNKSVCDYVYLDDEETGYLYFYQLKGYFSPYIIDDSDVMKSIAKVNANDEKFLIEYLLEESPDYVIVRNSKILIDNGYKYDLEKGKVYIINKNYSSIKDFLKEVE